MAKAWRANNMLSQSMQNFGNSLRQQEVETCTRVLRPGNVEQGSRTAGLSTDSFHPAVPVLGWLANVSNNQSMRKRANLKISCSQSIRSIRGEGDQLSPVLPSLRKSISEDLTLSKPKVKDDDQGHQGILQLSIHPDSLRSMGQRPSPVTVLHGRPGSRLQLTSGFLKNPDLVERRKDFMKRKLEQAKRILYIKTGDVSENGMPSMATSRGGRGNWRQNKQSPTTFDVLHSSVDQAPARCSVCMCTGCQHINTERTQILQHARQYTCMAYTYICKYISADIYIQTRISIYAFVSIYKSIIHYANTPLTE